MRRAGRGTFPHLVTRDAVDRSRRAPHSRRASPKSLRDAIAGWIAVAAVASFGMDGHLEPSAYTVTFVRDREQNDFRRRGDASISGQTTFGGVIRAPSVVSQVNQ